MRHGGRVGAVGMLDPAGHRVLGIADVFIRAGGDRGENRGAQCAALVGRDDLDGRFMTSAQTCMTVGDLRAMPPRAITFSTGTLIGKALHDGARTERRRRDESAEQGWGVGAQVQVGDDAFQALVGERRAPTVEPVEDNRELRVVDLGGPGFGGLEQIGFDLPQRFGQ